LSIERYESEISGLLSVTKVRFVVYWALRKWATAPAKLPSSPRRRGPSVFRRTPLGSRLRGNDRGNVTHWV